MQVVPARVCLWKKGKGGGAGRGTAWGNVEGKWWGGGRFGKGRVGWVGTANTTYDRESKAESVNVHFPPPPLIPITLIRIPPPPPLTAADRPPRLSCLTPFFCLLTKGRIETRKLNRRVRVSTVNATAPFL